MPNFSGSSDLKLSTCDVRLQQLFREVVKHRDCTVLCGHRPKEEQDKAVAEGKSKAPWPQSNHNKVPSMAVDVMPYPINWADREGLIRFVEFVKGVAVGLNIDVRWGGDFKSFFDGPHWEVS